MASVKDGPASGLFAPIAIRGALTPAQLAKAGLSKQAAEAAKDAPSGACVCRGVPFRVGKLLLVRDETVTVKFKPTRAPWLVFLHTSDIRPLEEDARGFIAASSGYGRLAEHAADYVLLYADGAERRAAIRRRHQVGALARPWGEECFEAVSHAKPFVPAAEGRDVNPNSAWGRVQTRVSGGDLGPWINWLWAWRNPHPGKAVVGVRFEPLCGAILVSAITAARVAEPPLRWRQRRKAILHLPRGAKLDLSLDESGSYKAVRLDLGQVISIQRRPVYPNRAWARTYANRLPQMAADEAIVEYTSHAEASFHLPGGRTIPVAKVEGGAKAAPLTPVRAAAQRVTVRAVEKGSGKPVAVKLHVHGEAGEYLAPNDRHRIPNSFWFQDYSVDFSHQGIHHGTYISGETTIELPLGNVYVEATKGFEIRPVRKVVRVTKATREITVEIEKVLPWRERNWVTADTHVHFLSPPSAQLEGAGEGVNVVNLLASQWGELMTNVGDFDGRTTFGSREAGGDGEYLVRVGTENRQHALGHISLLGYEGRRIAPMTTAGPNESAIGDPVAVLLTQWARQCKQQKGVVVIPHFPNPRCENAATIVAGDADAVEMTSWGNLYAGINPYSLSDWYRYLNCGYFVAAVGGTDKMSASTAVGTVRTYAKIAPDRAFTYEGWKDAIRRGETFVTYGPLMEFAVEGRPAGSWIDMPAAGGTVDVTWKLASVTVPMSRVELVVNGEIRESRAVKGDADEGHWSVRLEKSSWAALLVRGHHKDQPEIIAAHSSPVMVRVKGSEFFAAADAVTILNQIEGALAYIDTIGTRAEDAAYKRMRLVLTAAHRGLHNRMHRLGRYHEHTPTTDHREHH